MAMMNELVDQIASRTGISRDKAMGAARAAVDFLEERLPGPVGDRLKSMVEGDSETRQGREGDEGGLEGLGQKFGL